MTSHKMINFARRHDFIVFSTGSVNACMSWLRLRSTFTAIVLLATFLFASLSHAQNAAQTRNSGDPLSTLFRGPGFTTTLPPAADWVRKSRPPPRVLYDRNTPVPAGEPERAPLNRAQVQKIESDLRRLRARHDRAASRPPGREGLSAAPVTKLRKPNRPRPCVLTCATGTGTGNSW